MSDAEMVHVREVIKDLCKGALERDTVAITDALRENLDFIDDVIKDKGLDAFHEMIYSAFRVVSFEKQDEMRKSKLKRRKRF